jgi:hypothetical protein
MALVGLLLAMATAAFTADVVVENHTKLVSGTALHQGVNGMSLGGVFVAGAVTGLIFVLAASLFIGGLTRGHRHRRQRAQIQQLETQLAANSARPPAPEPTAYPADPASRRRAPAR